MKITLLCAYFLATAYPALASESEIIGCHNCLSTYPDQSCKALLAHEEKRLIKLQDALGQGIHKTEIHCCKGFGPDDPLMSIKLTNGDFHCVKVDDEVDFRNGTKVKTSYRSFSKKDFCHKIQKDLFARNGVDPLVECHECKENLCNSASTVKLSILVLVSSGLIYLIRK